MMPGDVRAGSRASYIQVTTSHNYTAVFLPVANLSSHECHQLGKEFLGEYLPLGKGNARWEMYFLSKNGTKGGSCFFSAMHTFIYR